MNMTISLSPLISLIAGILIPLAPRLLSDIVTAYLIVIARIVWRRALIFITGADLQTRRADGFNKGFSTIKNQTFSDNMSFHLANLDLKV